MQNLFVDLETTGLYPEEGHVILSIGMLIDNGTAEDTNPRNLVLTIMPTPEQWKLANPRALEVNGFTWEQLEKEGIPFADAVLALQDWLLEQGVSEETTQIIGQNPKFDMDMLMSYMRAELECVGYFWKSTDTIAMAKRLAERRIVRFSDGFSGAAISRALGVEPEGAIHTALGGILSLRRNYYALEQRLAQLQAA